jgi:glyoxylase-like metal-dependent hydrolase (beta-lactamase superfamily II)
MANSYSLPEAAVNQSTINLRQLSAGNIHLPLWMFVEGAGREEVQPCPSMSWLLTHPPSETNLVFDLGLPKDISCLTPAVQERLRTLVKIEVNEDVFDGLATFGLNPSKDINAVIFSHLHYDHIGDPSGFGPNCKYIVGPTALSLLSGPNSYPSDPHAHFDSNLLPLDRTLELPSELDTTFWKPLGPFPATHDYFGDGSMYIVNSAGHLPGHINLLVRLENEKWIYLAGDSCHDVRILRGEKETSVYPDPSNIGHLKCAHANKELAEQHLERVRKLGELGVEIVLAHDWRWEQENKGRFV